MYFRKIGRIMDDQLRAFLVDLVEEPHDPIDSEAREKVVAPPPLVMELKRSILRLSAHEGAIMCSFALRNHPKCEKLAVS
jgi:hypothetical protein